MSNPKSSFWRNNGLSLTLIALFLACWAGQSVVGEHAHNADREELGLPLFSFAQYLSSPHFLEATAENWESEFLQMGFYVVLTVFLFQRDPLNRRSSMKRTTRMKTRANTATRLMHRGRCGEEAGR